MTIATTAPRPALRQLLAAIRPVSVDDAALAAPWCGPGDRAILFSRAAWALRAVAELRAVESGRRPLVWLPGWFCNQATLPLREAADVVFYPVGDNLQPDWSGCEAALLKAQPPDAFVLVHYFGRPVETATARAFCDRHGAWLVEDAAHVLAPRGGVGRAADATLWSLYKHLPLPDGGLLTVRSGGAIHPVRLAAVAAPGRAAPAALGWMVRRALQRIAPAAAGALRPQPLAFDRDPPPETPAPTPAASRAMRRALAGCLDDIDRIAARRVANDAALRAALADTGLRPLLPASDGTWTPYRSVFRAVHPAEARPWYDRLQAAGNVVESWPDLPPEVRRDGERQATALALRASVIALPIHADRSPEELAAAYAIA